MRSAAVGLALVVALAAVPFRGTPAAAATLNSRLDALAGSFAGSAAVWISDPSLAQPLYARDIDRQIVTASLYKLAVMLETEHQVEIGKIRYSDTIVIDADDITPDGSFEAPGTEMTIDEALEAMITISDNGTAVHLRRMLGAENINAFLQKSGIKDLHIAVNDEDDNMATARAVGTYFTLLAKRQLISLAASERMLRRLERQLINDRLPAQLPEGTIVAHKTGNLVGFVHDAGIIFTKFGPRVVVAMTYDADDETADEFIAQLAATVYANVIDAPAAVRYRVPQDTQYVEIGRSLAFDVTLDNIGDDPWTLGGDRRIGLIWELRDLSNNVLSRVQRPLALGQVPPGGSVTMPLVVNLPARAGDGKLVVGLVDSNGRALATLGVATATIPLRVHLPFVAEADVRVPSVMHRREASMIEVSYTALEPVRGDDHYLSLGWRFIDPRTDRVIAQGQQPLGTMRTYERAGSFVAPLVAPNVRGAYTFEYEIRERGFVAGVTQRRTIEIGAPRSYGDEAGPGPALLRLLQQGQPRPSAKPTPRPPLRMPAVTPGPTLRPDASPTPRPLPRITPVPPPELVR